MTNWRSTHKWQSLWQPCEYGTAQMTQCCCHATERKERKKDVKCRKMQEKWTKHFTSERIIIRSWKKGRWLSRAWSLSPIPWFIDPFLVSLSLRFPPPCLNRPLFNYVGAEPVKAPDRSRCCNNSKERERDTLKQTRPISFFGREKKNNNMNKH